MKELRPDEMAQAAGGSSIDEFINTREELAASGDAAWIRTVADSFRKINDREMCLDVLIRALQDHVSPRAIREYLLELWP